MKKVNVNLVAITFALITTLLLYQSAPILRSASATADECEECQECSECLSQGTVLVPLTGAEAYQALSVAMQNEDVKILRATLIQNGYTPLLGEASAYGMAGEHEGLGVIIPFKGSVYGVIYYYQSHTDDLQDVRAAAAFKSDDQVILKFYRVNEEGGVTVTVIAGQSCTFDCVMSCCQYMGMSYLAALGCVISCVGCATSIGGPSACAACGVCCGIVLGCVDVCC